MRLILNFLAHSAETKQHTVHIPKDEEGKEIDRLRMESSDIDFYIKKCLNKLCELCEELAGYPDAVRPNNHSFQYKKDVLVVHVGILLVLVTGCRPHEAASIIA